MVGCRSRGGVPSGGMCPRWRGGCGRRRGDDQMRVHDALVRMVRRWEREGLRTERYELLYAAALGVEPEQLSSAPSGDEPAAGEAPAQFRPVGEALDLGGVAV